MSREKKTEEEEKWWCIIFGVLRCVGYCCGLDRRRNAFGGIS